MYGARRGKEGRGGAGRDGVRSPHHRRCRGVSYSCLLIYSFLQMKVHIFFFQGSALGLGELPGGTDRGAKVDGVRSRCIKNNEFSC